jgi:hypothetical protein
MGANGIRKPIGMFARASLYFTLLTLGIGGLAFSAIGGLPPNWRFVTPLPQGTDFLAAWAAAPNDLYVGGHGGVIQHWDGTNWTRMPTPTTKTIYSLHGLSPRDIWAVGGDAYTTDQAQHCLVLHWDGQQWTEMAPPKFSGWTYPMVAVCALGPKDVWAVTDIGTFPAHYDGTSWQFVSLPLSVEGSFRAITAVNGQLFLSGTHGQIVRYQSGTWTLEQKTESGGFSANILTALWGADLQNVYAGGSWGQVYRRNADGTWSDLQLGGGLFGGPGMTQIWGTSPTNIYLQGIQSIRHFDGARLTQTNDFQYSMRLQWFAGTASGNRIYGVGPGGVVTEFVLNGQGGGTLSPLAVGGDAYLSLSPKGAVACGARGLLVYGSSLYRSDTSPLVYFDGCNYHDLPSLPPGMAAQSMVNATWAGSLQDIVVAWDNFLTFERGVHHWNGTAWEAMGDPWNQPNDAMAFWRSPAGKLYACTSWRVMLWNGSNDWTTTYSMPEPEMQTNSLAALWGRSDSEVYIGGKAGKILRFDGSTWKTEPTPGAGVINGISGNAADVYAVGDNALVWRRVGTAWQKVTGVELREGDHFTQIVTGADGVYAAQRTPSQYTGGGLGLLWRLNGGTPTLVLKGLSQPIDLLGFTGGYLYGIAAQSSILSDSPAAPNLALQRLDLASTNWTVLGNSGVAVRLPTPTQGQPMVAAWRMDEPSTFLTSGVPGVIAASQHWFLRADSFNSGTALPPCYIRFRYDPARLPAGFNPANARLFRYNGKSWSTVAAIVDTTTQTVTTQFPSGLDEWTLGSAPPSEPLVLSVQRSSPQTMVLSWSASAGPAQLEGKPGLSSAEWIAVSQAPAVIAGTNFVTLETSGQQQFFRLRKLP